MTRSSRAPATSAGRTDGGRLLVVGTPIGNLADLSSRAAASLRDADLVVAEDTRVAAKLFAAIGSRPPTLSYNDHNARSRLPAVLGRLAAGETIALTTDAGMPGVSDPGAALVAAAREAGARIEVIPGPAAVTAAFAVSGIEADGFVFAGFLPARPASVRAAALERVRTGAAIANLPLVVYESTHRIRVLLDELARAAPDARVVVCRELTKLHEEVVAGAAADVGTTLREERGEFVVVVDERHGTAGVTAARERASGAAPDVDALVAIAQRDGLSTRTIVELLRAVGVSRREAYRLAGDSRGNAPQDDRPGQGAGKPPITPGR